MIKSKTIGGKTADILIYLTVIFMTMCCLFPLLNMVAISFSDKAAASANMVGLVPVDFTTSAYKTLLGESQFWVSFWISIKRVFLGTIINMILTILLAYPLSKSKREFCHVVFRRNDSDLSDNKKLWIAEFHMGSNSSGSCSGV